MGKSSGINPVDPMQPPKPFKSEEAEDTLQAGELKRFVI